MKPLNPPTHDLVVIGGSAVTMSRWSRAISCCSVCGSSVGREAGEDEAARCSAAWKEVPCETCRSWTRLPRTGRPARSMLNVISSPLKAEGPFIHV